MFLLTNLVSSISKITQDLGNIVSVNTTVTGSSSVEGQISTSGLLSDTLSTVTNTLTTTTTGLVLMPLVLLLAVSVLQVL